jgi:hypothetical protein
MMNNFSIEAFVTGCKTVISSRQNREQANRQLLETYCAYLQQQTRSK